jgi:pimeloyl-ACP methyl ester carboxylesterase
LTALREAKEDMSKASRTSILQSGSHTFGLSSYASSTYATSSYASSSYATSSYGPSISGSSVFLTNLCLLLWLFCLALPAAAAPIPKGDSHQAVDLGGITLDVLTYKPKHCTPAAMLLVFHGLHRNVEGYRDDLRPIADELCLLEAVPLFDEQRFPSWRYQKGGIAHKGSVLPESEWTGNLALQLVEWLRKEEGRPDLPYVAVGHSAGAQFLSRFAAFTPNDAKAIVVANPSTHVLASLDSDPPFGFKGVFEQGKEEGAVRDYLARPLIMVLGEEDTGDKDRDDEPAALQQGKTRYERGMNTFQAAQSYAAAHRWPFHWQLIQLPGVGHSAREVYSAKPVKAALRAALQPQTANSIDGYEPIADLRSAHVTKASFTRVQSQAQQSASPSSQSSSGQSSTQEQAKPTPSQGSSSQENPPQGNSPAQGSSQESSQGSSPEDQEVKITPRQADELFHSIDEILDFDSTQTGLPIKREVKRKLTSRSEVVSFLTKHMNDEDAQRLRRSELVLKKFGLLPHDFDLETFLVALMREEVAGYYDPKTKTVNLLDWVPMEEQEPVMAHELTHALQDQTINLQKWMKRGDKDLGEIKKDPTPDDIENDEMDDAREAVVEGQAQAMMFQYAIAPTGHSIVDSPALLDSMEEETLTGTPGTKVYNEAPIFMKESMTFPYSYGMEFIVKIMQKAGKQKAFAGVLQNPPHTTRQIMQPETYLSGEKIDPMRVPDFKHDFKDYQKFDIGAMGEFDVAVLIEQYVGKPESKRMYPEWRGGYYYAARPKTDPKAPLGLLYVSRWSNADKAAEFAGIYAQSLKQRYKKVDSAAGDAMPTPAEAEAKDSKAAFDAEPVPLKGRHQWTTEEGTVVIEEQGDAVLISESLDAATTATLEHEVFGK